MKDLTMTTLPAATAVPSLSTSAVLVDLSIGSWTASKKDKRVSADVARDNHADAKLARAYKTLISSPKLDAIKTFVCTAHEVNRNMTLDWAAKLRLCPTAVLPDHQRRMSQMEQQFFRLVDDFGADYDWLVMDMQRQLGAMHNPEDYPTWAELRRKFYFSASYMPLADVNDFRLNVAAETEAHLREHYERVHSQAIEQAMRGLYDRVHKAIAGDGDKDGGLLGALRVDTGPDGKIRRGRIYDSRITAVRELVDVLGELNVTGDSALAAAQRELRRALEGIDSRADLKTDEQRIDLHDRLQEIKANLPTLDW